LLLGPVVVDKSRPVCGRRSRWHVLIQCSHLCTGVAAGMWNMLRQKLRHRMIFCCWFYLSSS